MDNSSSNNKSAQSQDHEPSRITQLKIRLENAEVPYRILVHEQNISTSQDGILAGLGSLSAMTPTFIIQSETGFLAAIIRGDTRLSYKKIKRKLGLKNVSLATPDQVKRLTGSEVGYVSLINPGIQTIVDTRVTELTMINGGSGEPRHTLQVSPEAVITITQAEVFDFTDFKDGAQA